MPAIVDENGKVISQMAAADGDGSSDGSEESAGPDIPGLNDPVRVALIQQARDVIEARPEDAEAIIKQWINQETGGRFG